MRSHFFSLLNWLKKKKGLHLASPFFGFCKCITLFFPEFGLCWDVSFPCKFSINICYVFSVCVYAIIYTSLYLQDFYIVAKEFFFFFSNSLDKMIASWIHYLCERTSVQHPTNLRVHLCVSNILGFLSILHPNWKAYFTLVSEEVRALVDRQEKYTKGGSNGFAILSWLYFSSCFELAKHSVLYELVVV